jgi:hypothetical protein
MHEMGSDSAIVSALFGICDIIFRQGFPVENRASGLSRIILMPFVKFYAAEIDFSTQAPCKRGGGLEYPSNYVMQAIRCFP